MLYKYSSARADRPAQLQPVEGAIPRVGRNVVVGALPDILCEHRERFVGNDNCVRFDRRCLQVLPAQSATNT